MTIQLEIVDQEEKSYLFNNVLSVPRLGETIDIFFAEDLYIHGVVNAVNWSFISDMSECTATVNLRDCDDATATG